MIHSPLKEQAEQQEQENVLSPSDEEKSLNDQEDVLLSSQSNEHDQLENEADENRLLNEACEEVDNAANDLAAKIDLVTSPTPPATSGRQPPPSFPDTQVELTSPTLEASLQQPLLLTQSNDDVQTPPIAEEHENVPQATASATLPTLNSTLPIVSSPKVSTKASPSTTTASTTKKPTGNASTTRSSVAPKTKPSSAAATTTTKSTEPKPAATASSKTTEHKPTAAATSRITENKTTAAATKTTEPKAPTTVRKIPQSAPTSSASAAASHKPKATPPSPATESSAAAKPAVSVETLPKITIHIFLYSA